LEWVLLNLQLLWLLFWFFFIYDFVWIFKFLLVQNLFILIILPRWYCFATFLKLQSANNILLESRGFTCFNQLKKLFHVSNLLQSHLEFAQYPHLHQPVQCCFILVDYAYSYWWACLNACVHEIFLLHQLNFVSEKICKCCLDLATH